MNSLIIKNTEITPEIVLDHHKGEFHIRGISRPEDVRSLYSPVLEWMNDYAAYLSTEGLKAYSKDNPMIFTIELYYFNSSSAKFLFDIINMLKDISFSGIPIKIAWVYDIDDQENKEAGENLSEMAGTDFVYLAQQR